MYKTMDENIKNTNPNDVPEIVSNLRNTFDSDITHSYDWRLKQLKALKELVNKGSKDLAMGMYEDLHRSNFESFMLELNIVANEVQYAIDNLSKWMKPEKKTTNILNIPGSSYVKYDPLGVVLIMSPWNYPVQLLLAPLVGALAAGNTVLLRPAHFSKNTTYALAKLIKQYFDSNVVNIVIGDREVTTAVLAEKFDYIFFTGGTTLGKIVHQAANKHLTPVTLELGGKSPCYVDKSADIFVAAKRFTWATFLNAGQTCVRPDYLILHEKIADEFLKLVQTNIIEFYSGTPTDPSEPGYIKDSNSVETTPYFGRIIDGGNAIQRLVKIIEHDKEFLYTGGNYNIEKRFIEPTVFNFKDNAEQFHNSAAMKAEIFGPLVPVLYVKSHIDAIKCIKKYDKPLSLYCFTTESNMKDHWATVTTSGGLVFNDAVVHLSNHHLPFGGVGMSGMGNYHGHYSFTTFSHTKGVLNKSNLLDLPARYPPYDSFKRRLLYTVGAPIPTKYIKLLTKVGIIGSATLLYFITSKTGLPFDLPRTTIPAIATALTLFL